MSREKHHLGLVVVGHVDAGKSTTIGRLMFESGGIAPRRLEQLKQEAAKLGKSSCSFAFVMDQTAEERQRGFTIQCTARPLATRNYNYTIIDAPGHEDFIKNMISGASQADVALLMVPASIGEFEKAITMGNHKKGIVAGQTRQHAQLCHILGITQLIVGINKMDNQTVQYSNRRYQEIKDEVTKILIRTGYKENRIQCIPISGFNGDNLLTKSKNMPWYGGKTLFEALDQEKLFVKRSNDKPFRMPVSNILDIKDVDGYVMTGRIEQGTITPGVNVKFYPTGCIGKVFSIEMHHQPLNKAECGYNVGINIRNLEKDNLPKKGDIMVIDDKKDDKSPPRAVAEFTASVFVLNHPNELYCSKQEKDKKTGDMIFKGGFTPIIHVRTAKAPCQMIRINSKNKVKMEESFIRSGDQAEVVFKPLKPLVVSPHDECRGLGRVVAMNSNTFIMGGIVTKVKYVNH